MSQTSTTNMAVFFRFQNEFLKMTEKDYVYSVKMSEKVAS